MQRIMNSYRNGQLSNAEVIEELRKTADDIAKARRTGDGPGLSAEEPAFYGAIIKSGCCKRFLFSRPASGVKRIG